METATSPRQSRKINPGVVGILRRGYVIHQGDNPDFVIRSTKDNVEEIALNAKTARAYLHMFENYEEVAAAYGIPINKPARSMADQVQDAIDTSRRMNPGSNGMSPDEVSVLVSKTLAPLAQENAKLRERIEVLEQLAVEEPAQKNVKK